jgi:hypothetical protein
VLHIKHTCCYSGLETEKNTSEDKQRKQEMNNKTKEAVETLINGNTSDFNAWVKKARKLDILDSIEYSVEYGIMQRHEIVNKIRNALEVV